MWGLKQWINWKLVDKGDGKKPTKVPCDTQGNEINAHDPRYWLDYGTALAYGKVGFVLTENDPYFVIDLDHALVDGQWSDFSKAVCSMFAGAYCEISQSGTGLHIFARGKRPHGFKIKNSELGLEVA